MGLLKVALMMVLSTLVASQEHFEMMPSICQRSNGTCIPLNKTNISSCMGTKIPYQYTSNNLTNFSWPQIANRLQTLTGVRKVPKCWAAIQPLLCALFLPRCDPKSGDISLPTHEMCKVAQSHCKILHESLQDLIPFFDCSDSHIFPTDCKSDVRDMRFNTSGQCILPLINTDYPSSFYEGVEGCGLQCDDPMFEEEERRQIHKMVAWGATLSLICNLFTVASFVIDWRSSNKYPSSIIFYINFCFMVSNLGWLVQFFPGAREDVVCKRDGTLRLSEPSAVENLSCVIVFVMIYYFLIAACVWFVILTYAWHLRFKAFDKIQVRFDKKAAYFHLAAWSLPLILTITTMAAGQIDGNSVAGICFVGYYNHSARILLLIIPVVGAAVVGAYFLLRVLTTLIRLRVGTQEIITEKANREIRCTIIRFGVFLLLCGVLVVTSLTCHVYEMQNEDRWRKSLRKHIICKINPNESVSEGCTMAAKPSVAMIQLHLLVLYLAGGLMSSWVCTSQTKEIWSRAIARFCNNDLRNKEVMKKHKIISQAYRKRKEYLDTGRLSISINETHDPVGLNFELNSVEESQNFSSTWFGALPKLVTRRGALIDATTESSSSHSHRRRNSYDSEISYSVRRVSVESRRHSLDSQISVQIAELTATRKTTATPRPCGSGGHRRGRRRRRDYGKRGRHVRRGSSTSQDSQMDIQILTQTLTMGNSGMYLPKLLQRRPGNAGLGPALPPPCLPMLGPPMTEDESAEPHIEESLSEGINNFHRGKIPQPVDVASSRRTRKESGSSGKRKNRDSGHFDQRRSSRKKTQMKKTEEVMRSKDSGGSRKKYTSESDNRGKYAACKTEDVSDDENEWSSENESDDQYTGRKRRRGESGRSKRSVDVATQVCMQEMATQTEADPLPTANQSTQMTPPFNIRLINATLAKNGQVTAPKPRYNHVWVKEQETSAKAKFNLI